MACNGYNHRPDCRCDFRGGHAGTVPPMPPPAALLGDLAPPKLKKATYLRSPRSCAKCGLPTYFVRGRHGGSYIAAGDGTYLKHRCPKAVPSEPLKFRRARSLRGWLPARVASASGRGGGGQLLKVSTLAERPFRVRLLDGLIIDVGLPVMCRWAVDDPQVLELTYLDGDGEFTGTIVKARRLRSAPMKR